MGKICIDYFHVADHLDQLGSDQWGLILSPQNENPPSFEYKFPCLDITCISSCSRCPKGIIRGFECDRDYAQTGFLIILSQCSYIHQVEWSSPITTLLVWIHKTALIKITTNLQKVQWSTVSDQESPQGTFFFSYKVFQLYFLFIVMYLYVS